MGHDCEDSLRYAVFRSPNPFLAKGIVRARGDQETLPLDAWRGPNLTPPITISPCGSPVTVPAAQRLKYHEADGNRDCAERHLAIGVYTGRARAYVATPQVHRH